MNYWQIVSQNDEKMEQNNQRNKRLRESKKDRDKKRITTNNKKSICLAVTVVSALLYVFTSYTANVSVLRLDKTLYHVCTIFVIISIYTYWLSVVVMIITLLIASLQFVFFVRLSIFATLFHMLNRTSFPYVFFYLMYLSGSCAN